MGLGHAHESNKKELMKMNHGSMRSPPKPPPAPQELEQRLKQEQQPRPQYTPRNHVTRKRKAEAADLLLHFSRHEQQMPEHLPRPPPHQHQPQPQQHHHQQQQPQQWHHQHYLPTALPPVYYHHGPPHVNFAPVYPTKQEPMMKQGPMTMKQEAVHQPQFSAQEQQDYMNRFAGYYPSQPMYYSNGVVGETAQV
jgi:hypothetical protein